MPELVLPRLAGTRSAATSIVREANFPSSLQGVTVRIAARALAVASTSFANQLLTELSERGVTEVEVVGAPRQFLSELHQAASERHMTILEPASAA